MMRVADLTDSFPKLYHMAEVETWESIKAHGLLSTSALLDLFEVDDEERFKIESCHRPESITIRHATHGIAVIRDQKPMSDKALKKCLSGMTPREWYETLNRKVFFWLTQERLAGLLTARAYRDRSHLVLVVDTPQLLDRHLDRITLCPINSGCTVPNPQPRGKSTFLSIEDYPYDYWREKRRTSTGAVAELSVEYSIPDIAECVIRTYHVKGDERPAIVFER